MDYLMDGKGEKNIKSITQNKLTRFTRVTNETGKWSLVI